MLDQLNGSVVNDREREKQFKTTCILLPNLYFIFFINKNYGCVCWGGVGCRVTIFISGVKGTIIYPTGSSYLMEMQLF